MEIVASSYEKWEVDQRYANDQENYVKVITHDTLHYHYSPLLKSFLVGSLSGTCSTVLFQPLDLVKTRLQLARSTGGDAVTIISTILKKETILGLWRGMTPSIVRCAPGVGVYFGALHCLSTKFVEGEMTPLEAMTLGSLARTISGISMLPFTVIKTRFESGEYNYRGVLQALLKIYRTEGARGLYCGLLPTLIRDVPFSGIYLLFYTKAKTLVPFSWKEDSRLIPVNFTCGVVAGILASIVTHPADVIKTQMQLYPHRFQRITDVTIYIYKVAGVNGYFIGLFPRMIRRTLVTAMAWTVYERITKAIELKN